MNRDAREFIEHNPILMLANVGLDGLPKIRPMITLGIFKDTLWFAVTESKLVYKELMKDNNLELCSVTLSRWIRITGKAVFENDKQTIVLIIKPPTDPSIVFFGDILSLSLCFPNSIPQNNAKVSVI